MHPENYDPRDRDLAVNLVGSERFRELLEQCEPSPEGTPPLNPQARTDGSDIERKPRRGTAGRQSYKGRKSRALKASCNIVAGGWLNVTNCIG
jgi:hypothetical protein